MAGHSKFKNIMHRKGAQDRKRAKIFDKIAKEITVAAKNGDPDPNFNPRLRTAIQAAKAVNMPNDRINRAIKGGSGNDDAIYEEIRYEGFGPEGVAVIVEALTDNRNRTASEVRAAFSKNGGTLGETNSVSFMFDLVGHIHYPAEAADEETMFEAAVEAGAESAEQEEDGHHIHTAKDDLAAVRDVLEERFGTADECRLIWRPQTEVTLSEDKAETMMKLIDTLEDLDDVQHVTANFDIDEDIMEWLAG